MMWIETALITASILSNSVDPVAKLGPTCTLVCGTKVIAEVDISQPQHLITTQPMDSKDTQWEKLVFNFSVKLNPAKVAQFYIDTKELDIYKTEHGVETTTTVGLTYFNNIVKPAIVQAAKKHSIGEVLKNQEAFQNVVMEASQKALDKAQPGVFEIVGTQLVEAVQPESLKRQAELMGKIAKEAELQAAEQLLLDVRQQKANQDALVSAIALKTASKETGLNPSDIIEWEKAKKFGTTQAMITAK